MDVDGEDEDTTDLGYSDISDDDGLEVSMWCCCWWEDDIN
jgi:hypothetical protein